MLIVNDRTHELEDTVKKLRELEKCLEGVTIE